MLMTALSQCSLTPHWITSLWSNSSTLMAHLFKSLETRDFNSGSCFCLAWCWLHGVRVGTGRPGVSIMWLGEGACWVSPARRLGEAAPDKRAVEIRHATRRHHRHMTEILLSTTLAQHSLKCPKGRWYFWIRWNVKVSRNVSGCQPGRRLLAILFSYSSRIDETLISYENKLNMLMLLMKLT